MLILHSHEPTILNATLKVSTEDLTEDSRTQTLRMNYTLLSSFPWYTGVIRDYQKFSGRILVDKAMEVSSFTFSSKHIPDCFLRGLYQVLIGLTVTFFRPGRSRDPKTTYCKK